MKIVKIGVLKLLLILSLTLVSYLTVTSSVDNFTDNLVIKGLVSNPLNLTYSELETLPMTWEIAMLQCVYAPYGQPYNWTGIPLFYLLNLAKVKTGAKEVVFRAEDNFSSSLALDEAMHPSTILALKVNDTTLPHTDDYPDGLPGGYPYKVVVPCKYGYKWVGWIDEIEVVNYDYKGTYESMGFSDEADIPNCTGLPATTPPYTMFNVTWREIHLVTVFTNATVLVADFNQTTKYLYFTISLTNNSNSFVYVIVPKRLLTTNFTVLSENMNIQNNVMQSQTNSFVYFTLNQGVRTVKIKGMLLADITGPKEGVPDSKVNMRDISMLADLFGAKKSDPKYDPKYDLNSDENIDMDDIFIATEDFGKSVS